MAVPWKLAGIEIPAPQTKEIQLSIMKADHRTIDGGNSRDYVGNEKKIITCGYKTLSQAMYNRINTIRLAQIQTGADAVLFINQDGFQFNAAVIIDLPGIKFDIPNHYDYRNVTVTFIEK